MHFHVSSSSLQALLSYNGYILDHSKLLTWPVYSQVKEDGIHHECVALALERHLIKPPQFLKPITSQLLHKAKHTLGNFLIIVYYAPTNIVFDDDIDKFYTELSGIYMVLADI